MAVAACAKADKPLTAAELLDLGEKYLLELNYEQALVQFLKVIEIEPMNPRGYTGAAEAYIGLGDTANAEAALKQGLTVLPGNAEIQEKLNEIEATPSLGVIPSPSPEVSPDSPVEPSIEPSAEPSVEPSAEPSIATSADPSSAVQPSPATPLPSPDVPPEVSPLPYAPTSSPSPEAQPSPATPSPSPSSSSNIFSSVNVGDVIQFGVFDWRVLVIRDGRALLLSDGIVESWRPYHGTFTEITWEYSDIRRHLNSTFLDSFSSTERELIADTRVVNNNNPWLDTPGGNTTTDKIFLLSIEEVVRFFGDSGQLENLSADEPWIDDQFNQARIAVNSRTQWWLRSPGHRSDSAAVVSGNGVITCISVHHNFIGGGGVRPAMWLNIE
jgi:hypothetical protein